MTMPTQEAQRSRETAMQAERNWFVTRLQKHADLLRACRGMETLGEWAQIETAWLDDLIAERTK